MEKVAGQQETKPGGRFYPRQRKEKIVNVKGEESADASDGIPSLAHTHSRSHWRCLSVPERLPQHGGISIRVPFTSPGRPNYTPSLLTSKFAGTR